MLKNMRKKINSAYFLGNTEI